MVFRSYRINQSSPHSSYQPIIPSIIVSIIPSFIVSINHPLILSNGNRGVLPFGPLDRRCMYKPVRCCSCRCLLTVPIAAPQFGDEGQSASHWSCCELMDRAAPGCMRRIKGTGQYAGISGGGGGGGGGGSHHHHHHHHHHHQVSSVSSSSFVSSSRTKESSSSSSSSSQPSSNLSSKSSVALHVPKPGECQRCHRVPAAAAAVSPCPEGAQFHPGRFIFDVRVSLSLAGLWPISCSH